MAIRFDAAFLAEREAKQAKWIKNGVRTGSGKCFDQKIKSIGGNGGLPMPELVSSTSNSKIKKNKTKKAANSEISPHAVALAALSKNEKLRTGGMVNGKRKAANHEHWEQVMLFDWLYRFHADVYPDFSAIPNGGLRDNATAASLLAEGVKSGYPDIVCDIPMGVYHGLFIELKAGKNKPSENQISALNRKTTRGYFACVCYGFEQAKEVISEYLALPKNSAMVWSKNTELWLLK